MGKDNAVNPHDNLPNHRRYPVVFQMEEAIELDNYALTLGITTPELIKLLISFGLKSRGFKTHVRENTMTKLRSNPKPRLPKP